MKSSLVIILSLFSAIPCAWAYESARAANAHAFEMFQMFRQMTPGNFCFSPFSGHRIAAMLTEGSRGETQKQLLAMTHLPTDAKVRADQAAELRKALAANRAGLVMEVANSIWAPAGTPFDSTFKTLAQEGFGAATETLPANDPAASAALVNKWVRERTRDRITHIVSPVAFGSPNTVLLVNAVYLKASWSQRFDIRRTKPRTFNRPVGPVLLPMMMQTTDENTGVVYGESTTWQCLEMPLVGDQSSMIFLLPRQESDRAAVESGLNAESWKRVTDQFESYKVNIMLPRFSYSTQLDMSNLWQAAGARDLFDEKKADLTGMMSARYYVKQVLHESSIDVNEIGTEAAAASAAAAGPFGAPPTSKPRVASFIANHPFIWLIQHRETGLILFMGRFAGQ